MMSRRPPRAANRSTTAARTPSRSTGLLLNAIRTLTKSASEEQCELERERLRRGLAETTQAIDSLLASHQDELLLCLQSFRTVSQHVTASRERVQNVRNNLTACKSLLQCRRDDLKQLWRQNAEQRRVVQIIQSVDEIRGVASEVRDALAANKFITAAHHLMKTSSSIDTDLAEVEALQQVREEMNELRTTVFARACGEVQKCLYDTVVDEWAMEQLRRRGDHNANELNVSMGESNTPLQPAAKASANDSPSVQTNGRVDEPKTKAQQMVIVQRLAVACDALAVLGKLQEGIQHVRDNMHNGLWLIITRTLHACQGEVVHDSGSTSGGAFSSPTNRQLVSAFHCIFKLFTTSSVLHNLLLAQLRRAACAQNVKHVNYYAPVLVWHNMQTALVQLLNDYLGQSSAASAHLLQRQLRDASQPTGHAISTYFVKRRTFQRFAGLANGTANPTSALFRLAQTTHALNVNDDNLQGGRATEYRSASSSQHIVWLCTPEPENIAFVFRPLTKFAAEMRARLNLDSGDNAERNELTDFLTTFVNDTFLPYMDRHFRDRADAIFQSSDMSISTVSSEEQRELHADVPVLASSAQTLILCQNVGQLMLSLPPFAHQLAALWLLFLNGYAQCTQRVYEQITRSASHPDGQESVEWRKISAAWAVDEDISRLLTSLPNWVTLATQSTPTPTTRSVAHSTSLVFSPPPITPTHAVESAEEIRSRNSRESSILMGNLGTQTKINAWEMIDDMQHVRALATMHESLQWFARCMRHALANMPKQTSNMLSTNAVKFEMPSGVQTEVETISDALEKRLSRLHQMADTCLLMLHLEVRVHIFYFLLPLARQSSHVPTASQSQEPDPRVHNLTQDLQRFHLLLKTHLQARKVRYVFEGLGHLIAQIFIHGTNHIGKINDNGKKRMCRNIFSLQQTLSTMTNSREPDLDSAKRFFELLYKSPEAIINGIMERGPRFTELEYRYVLGLAIRSSAMHSTQPGVFDTHYTRLHQVFSAAVLQREDR